MIVTLIARTAFNSDIAYDITNGWEGDARDTDGALLTEFAGRACYQSWTKPNPATADNGDYINHIIEVDHTSVMEHGTMSFYIQEVSRSLTHELVRHRHLSPSQESQRYVKLNAHVKPVIPPLYRPIWEDNPMEPISEVQGIVEKVWDDAIKSYHRLVDIYEHRAMREHINGKLTTQAAKKAREAARCVLPNMTPTKITMTGNHRSWRHFLSLRGSLGADAEIRELALQIHQWGMEVEPALYRDFVVQKDQVEGNYLVQKKGR